MKLDGKQEYLTENPMVQLSYGHKKCKHKGPVQLHEIMLVPSNPSKPPHTQAVVILQQTCPLILLFLLDPKTEYQGQCKMSYIKS